MQTKRTLILICTFCIAIGAHAAKQKMMTIAIREAQLRSTPSRLSKVVKIVKYADRMAVVQTKGDWMQLSTSDGTTKGWIHSSALTKKKLVFKGGGDEVDSSVTSDEMAQAGKGFNSDVEAEFKARNKDIDFSWIDKMGKIKISDKILRTFLKTGGIKATEGGAQ